MSFGISAVGWLAIAAGTSAAASIYQASKTPNIPAPPAPAAPPQASQAPDALGTISSMKSGGGGGGSPGVAGTFLTGPGGIDPNSLTLGKSTLLGGGGG